MVTADTVYSLLLDVLEAGGDVEAVTWARKHRDTVLAWIAPVVEAINTRRSRASVAGRQTVGLAAEGPRGAFVYGMLHRPLDMNLIPGALSVGQHPAFPHGIVGVREALSSEDAERLGLVRVLTDSQLEAHGRAYGRSKAKYADQVRKMGVAALAAGIARHTAGIYVPSMTQYQRWVLEGLESAPKLASSAAPVSAVPAPDKQRAAVTLYRMVLDEEERRMAHASVGRRVGGDKAQLAFNQLDDTLRDFAIGLADVNGVFEPVGPGYVPGQPVSELPGHAVARLENQGAEVWLFVSPDGVKAFVQGLAGGQVYGLVGYKWQPSVVPRVFDTLGRAAKEGGLAARELALIAKEAAGAGAKPGHTEWDKASRASRPATDFASTLSSKPALVKPSEEPKFWHASRELTEHEREVLRTLPPDDVGAFLGVPVGGMGETAARRLGYVLWGVQSKTSPPAALLRKVGMLTTPAEVAQVVNEAFDAKRAKSSAAAEDAKAVAQAMKLPGRLGRYAKMVHDAMDAAKARAVALREEGAALKAVTGSAWRESSKRKQASNEDEQVIRLREELVRLGKSGRPPWTGKLLAWWESTEGAEREKTLSTLPAPKLSLVKPAAPSTFNGYAVLVGHDPRAGSLPSHLRPHELVPGVQFIEVSNPAEAVRVVEKFVADTGMGASSMPRGFGNVVKFPEEAVFGHVSYNGRYWLPKYATPLNDPTWIPTNHEDYAEGVIDTTPFGKAPRVSEAPGIASSADKDWDWRKAAWAEVDKEIRRVKRRPKTDQLGLGKMADLEDLQRANLNIRTAPDAAHGSVSKWVQRALKSAQSSSRKSSDILAAWKDLREQYVWALGSYVDNSDLLHASQFFSYRLLDSTPDAVTIEVTTLPRPVKPGDQKYTRSIVLQRDSAAAHEWVADIARSVEGQSNLWPVIPPPVVKDQTLLPLNTVVRMKKGKGKLWIVAGHKGWSSDVGHGGPNELYALSGGTKGSQTSASAQDLEVMKLPDVIANANDDGVVRWEGPEAGKRYQSYSFHIGAKNRLPFVLRGHSPTWYLVAEPAYLMLLHQGAMTMRFRRDTDIRGAWETLARESKDNVGYLWAPSVVSGGIQQWAFHVIRSPADIERVLS